MSAQDPTLREILHGPGFDDVLDLDSADMPSLTQTDVERVSEVDEETGGPRYQPRVGKRTPARARKPNRGGM